MMKKPLPKNLPRVPWMPVNYTLADVGALQAVNRGNASESQQQRAIKFIIDIVAGTYDASFYNQNEEGRRNTDFALGRVFVGQQLVKLLKADLGKLKAIEQKEIPL